MFSRLATLLPIAALVAVASAAPAELEARNPCSTGGNYCCNNNFTGVTPAIGNIGSLLTLTAGIFAGITCDPISVIGIGGNSCTEQVACCTNDEMNGLVVIGCSPINANL